MTGSGLWSTMDEEATARAAAGLRRELRPRAAADPVVDLAGNDYLGLSAHPEVVAAAAQAMGEYGLGATGSRLVRGTTEPHALLEAELAALLGFPATLVYSSGYLANLGAIRALVRAGTLVVSDAHNHASIVDGCRLACAGRLGREGASTVVSPHADPRSVAAILGGEAGRPAVVVTESVFSVDGDLAPLADLYAVCRRHGALLLVDDAHALGVLGPSGAGGVAAAGLAGAPDVVVTATLSKALGAAGGVVAGPAILRRHLVDTGRTFVYDTGLPPAVAAGVRAALRLLRAGDGLRAELASRATRAVDRLRAAGLAVSTPDGAILSIEVPSAEAALAWATACRDDGVAVGCFRPPSTPDGRARLRLTVNVGVPAEAFDAALDIVVKARP